MGRPHIPEKLPVAKIQWEPLIPAIGTANRAISLYSGILHGVQNPDMLLSPLATEEAVISSRIEGTQATLGDVLKFEAGLAPEEEAGKQDVLEILNYRKALKSAENALRKKPFNLNQLLELHKILLDSVRGQNKARGKFRTVQNWIGPPGSALEKATYVPPEPTLVKELMSNWEKYYHMDRPDPLVQLAVLHAQFELIHPFLDGNGRLGRMLVPIFLYEKKLLSRPTLYVSQYLEANRDEYYHLLRVLGESKASWNDWILFFLKALTAQAELNVEKARSIMRLYEKLRYTVIEVTHSDFAIPLLDILFATPILSTSDLKGRKDMPTTPMIHSLLRQLSDAGILKVVQQGSGRRPHIYSFPELIRISEGKGKTATRKRVKTK